MFKAERHVCFPVVSLKPTKFGRGRLKPTNMGIENNMGINSGMILLITKSKKRSSISGYDPQCFTGSGTAYLICVFFIQPVNMISNITNRPWQSHIELASMFNDVKWRLPKKSCYPQFLFSTIQLWGYPLVN